MIIFYPPPNPICTPVIIADMTDSSDQWSTGEMLAQALANIPAGIGGILPASIYSCKYNYSVQHNGTPLGQAMKMTLSASVRMPPSELIAQVSVKYFATAQSPEAFAAASLKAANPQMNIMHAVVVEKTDIGFAVCRAFIAYSSVLQPDTYGAGASLFIKGASRSDALVTPAMCFQLDALLPLGSQLSAAAAKAGFIVDFTMSPEALKPPICGKLFPPSTIAAIFDEVCLQNGMMWHVIHGNIITLNSQTVAPVSLSSFLKTTFSFLGYSGAVMWAVGVENYANVKFKTRIFDAALFSKITIFDDTVSGLFAGLNGNPSITASMPASYDLYVMRYEIIRNDGELCCEVTATNNWLFSQCRIDGILETKIYGGIKL